MSNIPMRVNALITRYPEPLCDRCIQEELGLRQSNQVQQTTSALATTSDFHRAKTRCAGCDKVKMVTRPSRARASGPLLTPSAAAEADRECVGEGHKGPGAKPYRLVQN